MKYTAKRKLYIAISAAAVVTVMVVIFMLSAQTATESTATSDSFIMFIYSTLGRAFSEEQVRTFAHYCEYAGLGFLVCNLFYSLTLRLKPIISTILAWCYAWSDEIHQLFVEGRAFQLSDLAVDLCGIITGVCFFYLVHLLIRNLSKSLKKADNNKQM